jgi:uncharacterized membrane protein YfcA
VIAGLFALGMVPGALAGSQLAHRLPTAKLRSAFGVILLGFAVWFLTRQVTALVP